MPADRTGSGDGRGREVAVAVIGGGQAGLAVGFYLQRAGLVPGEDFAMLDAADGPGWGLAADVGRAAAVLAPRRTPRCRAG